MGYYYTNSSVTYTNAANFNPTNLFLTRLDPTVDFVWGGTNPPPNLSNGLYTVRWTGQVQPQYSETYSFDVRSDDGCRLWVSDQLLINKWQAQSVTDVDQHHHLAGGHALRLQTGIPATGRLGPGASILVQPQPARTGHSQHLFVSDEQFWHRQLQCAGGHHERLERGGVPWPAVQLHGHRGATRRLGFTASGLPPGLAFNSTNGLISGIADAGGQFSGHCSRPAMPSVWALQCVNLQVIEHRQFGRAGSLDECSRHQYRRYSDRHAGQFDEYARHAGRHRQLRRAITVNASAVISPRRSPAIIISGWPAAIRRSCGFPTTASQVNQLLPRLGHCRRTIPPRRAKRDLVAPMESCRPTSNRGWLALVAGQQYYIEILHKAGAGAH